MNGRNRLIAARGFSLIEMVIALVIGSIMVGFIAMMITTPVQAYMAQSRRAELSDSAQAAIRTMSVELRQALPNSVRIQVLGTTWALEMIEVVDVANYRASWTAGEPLTTRTSDNLFDVTTPVLNALPPNPRLVVGNLRNAPDSAYRTDGGDGVITPAGSLISFDDAARTRIRITPGFTFTRDSLPRQRVYVVSTATRFECDPGNGELRRYRNLPITAAMAAVAAPFDVVARDVSACAFRVLSDGTAEHGGIVMLEITFSRFVDGNNESLRMARQVRVENPS
jgi:MSHA biogenesis protein MshO